MVDYSFRQRADWLRSLDARPSSAAVILENANGQALIVKATYKSHWTFPGGVIDAGESPAQAAVRETQEEVGLVIEQGQLQFGWVAYRASQVAETYQFVFYAPLPAHAATSIVLQASEIEDYAWVSKADVLAGERHYGEVIQRWAESYSGYVEQTFGLEEV